MTESTDELTELNQELPIETETASEAGVHYDAETRTLTCLKCGATVREDSDGPSNLSIEELDPENHIRVRDMTTVSVIHDCLDPEAGKTAPAEEVDIPDQDSEELTITDGLILVGDQVGCLWCGDTVRVQGEGQSMDDLRVAKTRPGKIKVTKSPSGEVIHECL